MPPQPGGAGILAAIPWDVVGPDLPPALRDAASHRIAAMFALDPTQADRAIVAARSAFGRLGWYVMAWRDVPMRLSAVAPDRRAEAPRMVQCFASAPRDRQKRTPYRTRLAIEARWLRLGLTGCSVASLSDSTMVYKGLVDPLALASLFPDLLDERFVSAFAVLHHQCDAGQARRWDLAQPFHGIAHDGAIRTITGNRLWMDARISDAGTRDDADLLKAGGSDSQTLDAAVQWLRETGLSTAHALTRLLPNLREHHTIPPDVHAFFRHEACFAEPWDGPATVAFADGRYVGAMADPYDTRSLCSIETDDLACVASDPAIFDLADACETHQRWLDPGEILVVDLEAATLLRGDAVWRELAAQNDYAEIAKRLIRRIPTTDAVIPGAVSLRTLLGRRGQWTSHALPPVLLELDSPVLLDSELEAVLGQPDVRAAVLPIGFAPGHGDTDWPERALATLKTMAAALAANGTRILVLSDRRLDPGLVPLPSLLATAAVDSGLRSAHLRLRASIVVEAADIRDAHHVGMLGSLGASAVVPHALYAAASGLSGDARAAAQCRMTLEDGLRTILSDMGVSSYEAYCGARLNAPASAGSPRVAYALSATQ